MHWYCQNKQRAQQALGKEHKSIKTEIGSRHRECSTSTKQGVKYMYCEVTKTIQCAHPPHHRDGLWLCSDMPATYGQWWSSRIVSARTNRVLNKHQARSINALKQKLVHDKQSAQQAQSKEHNICTVKSQRQSNAPILLITVMVYGFVATSWLWMVSGEIHALLLLEPTECSTSTRQGA